MTDSIKKQLQSLGYKFHGKEVLSDGLLWQKKIKNYASEIEYFINIYEHDMRSFSIPNKNVIYDTNTTLYTKQGHWFSVQMIVEDVIETEKFIQDVFCKMNCTIDPYNN